VDDQPVEVSVADLQDLALENFLLRRDLRRARLANAELHHLLQQVPPSTSGDTGPTVGG
jgi:hypothetical protein